MFNENTSKIFTLICNIHNKKDLEIITNLVNERKRQLENN